MAAGESRAVESSYCLGHWTVEQCTAVYDETEFITTLYNNDLHRYIVKEFKFSKHRWLWFGIFILRKASCGITNKSTHLQKTIPSFDIKCVFSICDYLALFEFINLFSMNITNYIIHWFINRQLMFDA